MRIEEVSTLYKWRCAALGALLALAAMNSLGEASPHAPAKPRLTRLIEEVLAKGPASQIPQHLSVVLGITATPKPTAVKQAVMRDGEWLRTFNVRSDQHGDVVLMAYDEGTRATKAYLTDPSGKLRKAVSYQTGEAPTERQAHEASGDFAAEVKFWTNLSQAGAQVPR